MKYFVTAALFILVASSAYGQVAGSVSTAVEPALVPRSQQVGVSVAGSLNVSTSNSVSLRYGAGNTVLAGVGRSLVEFLPGFRLVGDIQAGGSRSAGHVHGLTLYGAGVATDLGNGYSVTYGLHIDKPAGTKMYPSVYVSLGRSF